MGSYEFLGLGARVSEPFSSPVADGPRPTKFVLATVEAGP
jgi:hypothetical protein